MEAKKMNEKLELEEVVLEEITVLEDTVTPGFGLVCGNSCWGIGCW